MAPQQFPAPRAHGPIQTLFDDVWSVQGSVRMGPAMTTNRTMTVLRHEGQLTLVNAVRLNPVAQAELDELGVVKHVFRIGDNHGMDDAYYVDHYGADMWCLAGAKMFPDPKATRTLEPGGELPIPDLSVHPFELTTIAEAVLLLDRKGGLLIACDSLQCWTDKHFCSLPIRVMMPLLGFTMGTQVGPPWTKMVTPRGGTIRPDFERILTLDFCHLIGAHGGLCRDTAKEAVRQAVEKRF